MFLIIIVGRSAGTLINLIKIRSSIRSSFFIFFFLSLHKKDEERGADRGSDFNQIGTLIRWFDSHAEGCVFKYQLQWTYGV